VPIQVARTDATADTWIAREQAKPGDPLVVRVQTDKDLSPAEKATTLAKIEARDSAKESARVATVRGLDDKLEATADALATKPANYKPGTLAALANAYEDAGETAKAGPIRQLAQQEGFLRAFAQSSTAAQQRLIDSLPESEDRAAAEAIRQRQAEAFATDAFAAGTALYPEVGPPKSIEDIAGRIAQARTIAAYRGIPVVPFTADEIGAMRRQYASGTPQEREAVLRLVNAVSDDMKPALDGPPARQPGAYGIDVEASMRAARELRGEGADENETGAGRQGAIHASEPPPDSPEYRDADAEARQLDVPSWKELGFFQKVGVAFARFNQENKQRGAALSADSAARHWQQVQELQRRQDAGEPLNVVEKQYLLRNRRAASDLAQAVSRLVDAQRNIDRLPTSDALRQLLGASTAAEAARVLHERPGEIAQALGVESLPALILSLVALSVLGPVGGGLVLTGSGGLEGYANGLVGALTKAGVDVSRPDELVRALQDKVLMDRVRGEATTDGAIEAGITAVLMAIGGPRSKGHHWVPTPQRNLPDLSPEARKVFNARTSGWYGEPHPWSKEHAVYNQGIAELWNKNGYNHSKMTAEDAQNFIDQIMQSRDPRIAPFNAVIALQPVGERLAFGLVARQVERSVAQVRQLRHGCRCSLDGVGARLAKEGVGRGMERVLAGGDEAVGETFDAVGIDRRRRRFWCGGQPVGPDELGHGYATLHSSKPRLRSGLLKVYTRIVSLSQESRSGGEIDAVIPGNWKRVPKSLTPSASRRFPTRGKKRKNRKAGLAAERLA
jgi:hypothetical protein